LTLGKLGEFLYDGGSRTDLIHAEAPVTKSLHKHDTPASRAKCHKE